MNEPYSKLYEQLNQKEPHSPDAETAILQICARDNARLQQVRAKCTPDAFYGPNERTVWEAMVELTDAEQPIDFITVSHRLREKGKLESVGGTGYVSEVTGYPPSMHFAHYFEILVNAWIVRRAIIGHAQAIRAMFSYLPENMDSPNVPALLASCNELVTSAVEGVSTGEERVLTMNECVAEHTDYMMSLGRGDMQMIPIGIPSFDKKAGGIASDEYCLITGPTKSGKTTFGQKIYQKSAAAGFHCAYLSAEVSTRTIGGRAIFSTGRIDARFERSGVTERGDMDNYGEAVKEIQRTIGKTARVVNVTGMSFEEMLSLMRQLWEQGIRMFVVDYIGKLYSAKKWQVREREIAYMSTSLFNFTKRQGKPSTVICLAQLNDDGQVRDCRGLEHDCDMHLKITRVMKQPANKKDEPVEVPGLRTLIVERGRSIESGYRIPIFFDGAHYKFEECRPDETGQKY